MISSHSVALAIANHPRSISDALIKAIAGSGGVCSINMVGASIDTSNPDIVTTDMVFRPVDYMAELVGINHVGFGSDYIPNIPWTGERGGQRFGPRQADQNYAFLRSISPLLIGTDALSEARCNAQPGHLLSMTVEY